MGLLPKFVDDAAGPPAQAVGNTLAGIWELAIGSHVDLWIKKQEVRQQKNLKDYIKKVEEKAQEIPEEFLAEPQMHVVGPAIEASKYYIDSEELREMFANLIAASIDSRKSTQTHPSFVEIIKQLSPFDARVLANFKTVKQFPIAQVKILRESLQYIITHNHVVNFVDNQSYKTNISSISNLQRLGLLEISYSVHSVTEGNYDFVKDHPAYLAATDDLLEIQKVDPTFIKVDIQKGLCSRTPLGEDFVMVCL